MAAGEVGEGVRALWKLVPGERVREEIMCVMELQAHRDLVAGEQWEASSAIWQAEGERAGATSRRWRERERPPTSKVHVLYDLCRSGTPSRLVDSVTSWSHVSAAGNPQLPEPIGVRDGFGVRLPTAQAGLADLATGESNSETPTAREAGRLARCGEAGVQKIESVGDETLGRGR